MFEWVNQIRDKFPPRSSVLGVLDIEKQNPNDAKEYFIVVEQDFLGRATGIIHYVNNSDTEITVRATQKVATLARDILTREKKAVQKI